ncbi:MAG: hypothetical protein WA005_03560 [Candidatus Binataceae bacterium]
MRNVAIVAGSLIGAAALALALSAWPVAAEQTAGTSSGTQAATIDQLRQAEQSDRMNATSWTADNPTLDHYYDQKADQVDTLIKQLEAGQTVSPKEVDRALDTSGAQQY